jgi:hypothetical protein
VIEKACRTSGRSSYLCTLSGKKRIYILWVVVPAVAVHVQLNPAIRENRVAADAAAVPAMY